LRNRNAGGRCTGAARARGRDKDEGRREEENGSPDSGDGRIHDLGSPYEGSDEKTMKLR
jgi:hypothetical protein